MRVAVMSLTRDRLIYTQHCFNTLRENAGIPFDHFVYDQGSEDGTPHWLQYGPFAGVVFGKENIGISRGLNALLDLAGNRYDVIVKVDNDCELITPNTLRDIAELALATGWLLSPQIEGIGPVPTIKVRTFEGYEVHEKFGIGGIFLAATGEFYDTFRYSEANPTWGRDDDEICRVVRGRGKGCGYVQGYTANHYETTVGQEARFPEYFARKVSEGMPWA